LHQATAQVVRRGSGNVGSGKDHRDSCEAAAAVAADSNDDGSIDIADPQRYNTRVRYFDLADGGCRGADADAHRCWLLRLSRPLIDVDKAPF